MTFLLALKVLFLLMGVFFTSVNWARAINKNDIPVTNFLYQAVGVAGFIALQWLI